MHIQLKVTGKNLFSSFSKEIKALPTIFQAEPISWHLVALPEQLPPETFLYSGSEPCVIVIEANGVADLRKIEALDLKITHYIKSHPEQHLVRAPVMVMFASKTSLRSEQDLPNFVSDWTCGALDTQEFSRRVFNLLKRQNILKATLQYGAVTLTPATDDITFGGAALHLPPSEYALAELFFSQIGVVVPFTDVIAVFKHSGKSTATSNIRVAIYQLRLKLAILTKSEITLANVYKKGYCLRDKTSSAN